MKTKILLILVLAIIGILFLILFKNSLPLFVFAIGGIGEVIAGEYSWSIPSYPKSKVIGGCYGTCPSAPGGVYLKTMASSCAQGGL